MQEIAFQDIERLQKHLILQTLLPLHDTTKNVEKRLKSTRHILRHLCGPAEDLKLQFLAAHPLYLGNNRKDRCHRTEATG